MITPTLGWTVLSLVLDAYRDSSDRGESRQKLNYDDRTMNLKSANQSLLRTPWLFLAKRE